MRVASPVTLTIHKAPASLSHYCTNTTSIYYYKVYQHAGVRGGAVGWGTALQVGRSRVRFPMVSLEFFIDIILLAALWAPGGSTQTLNEILPEGGKGGRCVGLTTLPPSCTDCLEIWELQPTGTNGACPGL
jgi:hypothetical protein